jgi:hypothetical protein
MLVVSAVAHPRPMIANGPSAAPGAAAGVTHSITASVVTGVDFVSIGARKFGAAFDFYGNVLGLPCASRYDHPIALHIDTATRLAGATGG